MRFLVLFFLVFQLSVGGQTCLPSGIIFQFQNQIDNFSSDYPGCTQISGNIVINDFLASGITNLTGLNQITQIDGNLEIAGNAALSSLTGLNNLSNVEGNLVLINNSNMSTLDGLENLNSIAGFLSILNLPTLNNVDALSNLVSIGGSLTFQTNNMLVSLPLGFENLPAGNYIADQRVQVTKTYLDIFPATTQIIDQWGRLGSTVGISAENPITAISWADFDFTIQDNVASVVTTNFAWHLSSSINGQSIDVWIPAHPSELKSAYSLHLFDGNAVTTNEIKDLSDLKVSPNPSSGIFDLTYALLENTPLFFQVLDIRGNIVLKEEVKNKSGSLNIDLTKFSSGIYICQLVTEKGMISKKISKL